MSAKAGSDGGPCICSRWWRRARISSCNAARVRKTDNVEASNADNTAVGENSRKVRNLHYISQIRICEKHSWKQVEIVDGDLGCSAAMASARREGFERVLSSVALGEGGIVGSREVSRLSRTDKDWCRLLEVCQIFGTLIADEQQVYALNYLDDQLVLGIKATLSVVELNVLGPRLQAGQESKSPRGELFNSIPVGEVRAAMAKVEVP